MSDTPNAYERGWNARHQGNKEPNPFEFGTEAHCDYERGWVDEWRGVIDAKLYLGKDFLTRAKS